MGDKVGLLLTGTNVSIGAEVVGDALSGTKVNIVATEVGDRLGLDEIGTDVVGAAVGVPVLIKIVTIYRQ